MHTLNPTAISNSSGAQSRFRLHPNKHNAAARIGPGENGLRERLKIAVVVVVFIVRVVEAGPADRLTVPGEKLHEAPAGSPEQAKVIAELNAPFGVRSMLAEALRPAVIAREAGFARTVRLGLETFALAAPPFPAIPAL